MLIDATHAEETRVVVVKGTRLEEFDLEAASKKQLKGNIYLAKVTRVEPSLQAAFVDYGGNRHGFLAFNEIHPDYYQIPVADREALLEEEAQRAQAEAEQEDSDGEAPRRRGRRSNGAANGEGGEDGEDGGDEPEEPQLIEQTSSADALDEIPRPRQRSRRQYKIQEVIKKRQILLVQVVKEERGNKGAALTTYLSLAGRYCVLMPNTARGGGISRKITNVAARRKLKTIASDLDVPEGMGVIVRTAGMNRTKSEIKRDFEYLLRVWDQVRELTLKSSAPALVYEEASLIKRAIRDLYTKDVDEVLVEGEEGYRSAKEVMRLLLPSHARKVQPYRDRVPLYFRYQVEQQLESMHANTVQLRSGGYVVINPTEALVAIDVNSGRSTREHHIEETALKTNLEAAEEVSRQLRLRDLAGLIVIDFIDMEDGRNNRAVERRLKDSLKADRARIQIGRISSFGLMEMSRQRLRPSLIETSSLPCSHCGGTGYVRTTESATLHVLRALEEEGIRDRATKVVLHVPSGIALYILNQKRQHVARLEARYDMAVEVQADDSLIPPACRLEIVDHRPPEEIERRRLERAQAAAAMQVEAEPEVLEPEEEEEEEAATRAAAEIVEVAEPAEDADDAEGEAAQSAEGDGEDPRRNKRRRRRRKRRGEGELPAQADAEGTASDTGEPETVEPGEETPVAAQDAESETEEERGRRRRRRGRRGTRRSGEEAAVATAPDDGAAAAAFEPLPAATADGDAPASAAASPEAVPAVTAPATPEQPASYGWWRGVTEPAPEPAFAPAETLETPPAAAAPTMPSETEAAIAAPAPEPNEPPAAIAAAAAAEPVLVSATEAAAALEPEPVEPPAAATAEPQPEAPPEAPPAAADPLRFEPAWSQEPVSQPVSQPGTSEAERAAAVEADAAAPAGNGQSHAPEPAETAAVEPDPDRPKRRGWWQRRGAEASS